MNDVHHDLSFMVATNMPEALKSMLLPKLEMVYPKALKTVATAQEGRLNSFPSVHYSFWFKYGRKVCYLLFFFWLTNVVKFSRVTVLPLMLILPHCKRMESIRSTLLRMSPEQA